MRAWRVVRYGQPSEAMELQDIPTPEPGPGEVRVRTAATVLNYNDVDGCRGRYITVSPPIPYTLGMEVVGVVEAAGPGAEAWLGRRVMASAKMAYGGYAEQVIAPAAMVFDAPEALDDREAAAFFFPFHLAWLGLHARGGMQAGDSVLVHAGAGGVGSAAIQLARAAGAHVIATAGGPEKLALCRELGAEVAIEYRRDDFEPAVMAATGGRGVDLCFEGVGGETTAKSMRCLAANGRLLVIGFAGGIEAEDQPTVTPRVLCFGSVALVGVMLAYAPDDVPQALNPRPGVHITPRSVGDRVQSALLELLAAGKIRPVIGETIPFAGIAKGLDRMEQRLTTGRVIALI
jgi:NADPH2:quinone reductase